LLCCCLTHARFGEDYRVLRQLVTLGCGAHTREELRLESRRLPKHVHENEPVCSGIAHSRDTGDTLAREDVSGVGQRGRFLAIVIRRAERLDNSLNMLRQCAVFGSCSGLACRASSD
jgi:hypothetical protein